jgi:undecaprenyl diphosphate synthase
MDSEALARVRLGGAVPRHIAVIMDGNGRWAAERGLPRRAGHRQGMEAVRETIEGSVAAGVEILTLFAFSTENWQRPAGEVSALMNLLQHYARSERDLLRERGVEVQVLGEVDRLDEPSKLAVRTIVNDTAGGDALRLNLMISYSGREELVRAARLLAERVRAGELDPASIGDEVIESALFTQGIPDPDLLIRTSGEMRLSNFMLWQLAYTEIHICPVFWPDFTSEHLFEAVLDYQRRERRFGRVSTAP